jgi:hypothetical protein
MRPGLSVQARFGASARGETILWVSGRPGRATARVYLTSLFGVQNLEFGFIGARKGGQPDGEWVCTAITFARSRFEAPRTTKDAELAWVRPFALTHC